MSTSRPFTVGQAVVLVGSFQRRYSYDETVFPKRGPIYHVRELVLHEGRWGLRLVEIVNAVLDYGKWGLMECLFDAAKFVPVEEHPEEALQEILHHIFHPHHAEETERVPVRVLALRRGA